MPRPNWIIDVEIIMLRVLLFTTSILMNVVFALLGWELGRLFINFIVGMFFTNNSLIMMIAILTVDWSVERLLLLFVIFQTITSQNHDSRDYLEDNTIVTNTTQSVYL